MDWALYVTGVGAFATAFALLLNWRLLRETVRLREVQTEPAVSVHLERGSRIHFLNLVIQNYGQGPAFGLTWEVTPSPTQLEKYGPMLHVLELLKGFEHLAPKQRIDTFFGSVPELLARQCPAIEVIVRYKNEGGVSKAQRFTLNPCQFAGINECGDLPDISVAHSLEKIVKSQEKIARSQEKIAGAYEKMANDVGRESAHEGRRLLRAADEELGHGSALATRAAPDA